MKFFSNEAARDKERAVDDTERRDHNDPEAAVPQQRVGSPWGDRPAEGRTTQDADDRSPDDSYISGGGRDADDVAEQELADRERRDGTDEAADRSGTAGSADSTGSTGSTGSGAAISEPVDVPLDDPDDDRPRQTTTTGDADEHRATTTTYGPDGSVVTTDEATGRSGSANVDGDSPDAIKDDGTFDDPRAVDPVTQKPLDATTDDDAADRDRTDGGTASPATSVPSESAAAVPAASAAGSVPSGSAAASVPSESRAASVPSDSPAASVPSGSPAASVPSASPTDVPGTAAGAAASDGPAAGAAAGAGSTAADDDRLFPGGEDFLGRLREVQLRFIDGPKDATAEAASLVDEALDKLVTALRERKTALDNQSEDTEQLRVALRGYRDLLTRLTNL